MFGFKSHQRRDSRARTWPDAGADPADAQDAYRLRGFTAGTRIATALGWRPVEAITVGDQVMTFDNGMQTVLAVTRGTHHAAAGDLPAFAVPVHVPIEAIGNDEPMVLLPEQVVMIESDAAEALTGDPFALVPAKALEGYRGIDRIRGLRPVQTVTLHFDEDEIVFVEGGALVLAPAAVPGMVGLDEAMSPMGAATRYSVHRGADARTLVEAMGLEDARAFAQSQAVRAA